MTGVGSTHSTRCGISAGVRRALGVVPLEIHEFIDAGDQVVTPFTNHLRGREGIELEGRGAWVWTIRDALIVQVCLYQERREALEAAGLSE